MKKSRGIVWIVIGAVLWLLQILSIMGNQGVPLNFTSMYGVGLTIGSWIGGILGTIFIIVGFVRRKVSAIP